MLQQMRSSTREMAGEDSVFNDRVNRDMQDMTDRLLADNMAGQRAFGIADAVLRQLLPAPLNNSK
jgi:flagellar protein FlgJ